MSTPIRLTLRLRVAAAFALLGLAVSLSLGVWLYLASQDLAKRLIDEALDAELEDYLKRLARNPRSLPPETATLRGWLERTPIQVGGEGSRAPLAATAAGGDERPLPPGLRGLPPGRHTLSLAGASWRAAVHRLGSATLYLLHSRAQLDRRDRRFALLLVLGVGLTGLLSAAGGWWLAGRVTAPVRALAARVQGHDPVEPAGALLGPESERLRDDEVGDLAQAIDGYLRRLRAFVERERTFVSSVSHELRTPLAVIQGAVEILETDASLAAPQRERIARIGRATQGMADLAAALLTLAREGQGRTSPPTPCPVDEVLSECVEHERPALRHKPVALYLHIRARPVLDVARPLLAVALGNLIRNACSYTERGRVDVTLEATGVRVDDTGPGIPPAELRCLFGESAGCRRRVRGAGIGLPLVKRIADGQGWSIGVENRPGTGASFRLGFAGSAAPAGPVAAAR